MEKRLLSVLIVLMLLLSLFSGCNSDSSDDASQDTAEDETENTVEVSDTDLAYSGELTLMHFSTSEESEGNGSSDAFRTVISSWDKAHPDIEVNQAVLANDDYKTQISTLAAADDLPDVFLLQGMHTIEWSEQELVMDLTDIIKDSPYYDNYDQELFYPFTNEEKIYGFPVLTGGTCTVVVYDKALWEEAGFDSFPDNWNDVKKAMDYFNEQKIDTIAFGNGSKWQANSTFLSTLGNRFTGSDWFRSIIEKKGAKFTDDDFVEALTFTQDIFASGLFNKDFNTITNEDARELYIDGSAASLICGNWDVSYIKQNTVDDNTELYENTKFAVLPQPEGATGTANSHNLGIGYSVAINSNVEGDKLDAAIDFAYESTGEPFAKYVGENYAESGLMKTDLDLSSFDQFTQDFYNYSYVDNTTCDIYDSFISGAVWDVLNTDLQTMLNGEKTPEEVAENAQKAYEENY
jgi:multiple sugar transport system substrate-binding protein/raffinose/stachyose/melibiose transport system substrate-binding protein